MYSIRVCSMCDILTTYVHMGAELSLIHIALILKQCKILFLLKKSILNLEARFLVKCFIGKLTLFIGPFKLIFCVLMQFHGPWFKKSYVGRGVQFFCWWTSCPGSWLIFYVLVWGNCTNCLWLLKMISAVCEVNSYLSRMQIDRDVQAILTIKYWETLYIVKLIF